MTTPPFIEISSAELPVDRALRRGAERLQRAVAGLPLCYAPFYERLARLWEVSEDRVKSELTRARDESAWSRTLLPGLRSFDVRGGADGATAHRRLLKLAPGSRFPSHRHRGREDALVLEGAYADGEREVHAGDQQSQDAGGEHELRIIGSSSCVVAISERGIAFTSPWLRWVNPLLR